MSQYRDDVLRSEIERGRRLIDRLEKDLAEESEHFRRVSEDHKEKIDRLRLAVDKHRLVIAALEKALTDSKAGAS